MKVTNRITSVFLSILMLFSIFASTVSADSATAISTYDELCKISENLAGHYYLANDIYAPEGKTFKAIGSASEVFSGTFDGKGHKIFGLNIVASDSSSGSSGYAGLFGYNKGIVKNLNVEEAVVNISGKNWAYAGIIAGINQGSITNCLSSGVVNNSDISIAVYTGGICGKILSGEVSNCISYANIYSSIGEQYTGGIAGQIDKGKIANAAVYGSLFAKGIDATMDAYIGGICGRSVSGAEIVNCLFDGGLIAEKNANAYLGGICGQLKGKVANSVALGSVTPSEIISHTYIGGIVGDNTSKDISDSYYLETIINEEITGKYGTALTSEQINEQSSFDALDFSSVWFFKEGRIKLNGLPEISKTSAISQLIGIKIDSKPTKLTYNQGDSSLDLRGLKVSAIYNDKIVSLEQNDYTVGGYNYVKSGEQTVTVSYMGFTDSFTVNVKESSSTIIGPAQITIGSYSEGNADGVIATDTKSSNKDSSSTAEGNNSVVTGGNVVEDTLNDDEVSSSVSTKEGEGNSKTGIKDSDEKGKENPENSSGGLSTVWCILIALVAIAIITCGVLYIVFLTHKKKKSTQNEISNSEIQEVEHDENDVY